MKLLNEIPWSLVLLLCFSLGLAPFSPPHLWEKMQMLFHGELVKVIDWFDLFMHGFPWAILILKIVAIVSLKKEKTIT